ncbi:hypothetical protein [Stenotrophomonas forensis]|uniref:hypothetical protein n=1 Tax=Stenotrophomonas forensis TaxID=2871169 RepID=UPI0039C71DE7
MIWISCLRFGALLLPSIPCCAHIADTIPQRFEAMSAVEQLHRDSASSTRMNAVMRAYEQLRRHAAGIPDDQQDLDDLHALLDAARLALVYQPGQRLHQDVDHAVSLLLAKNAATRREFELLYDAAIGARSFDDATRVKHLHPTINRPVPPRIVEATPGALSGISVLRPGEAEDTLARESLEIQKGRWLVIVASPSCSFSNRATAYFETSAHFRNVLEARGISTIWLQPVEKALNLERARTWSDAHPQFRLFWARSQSDWPMLGNWDTPTFHLLEDGVLLATHTGWRGAEDAVQIDALLSQLDAR